MTRMAQLCNYQNQIDLASSWFLPRMPAQTSQFQYQFWGLITADQIEFMELLQSAFLCSLLGTVSYASILQRNRHELFLNASGLISGIGRLL